MFIQAMTDQANTEAIEDGLKAAVRGYYDNYTDAVELDGTFVRALMTICSNTFEYDLDPDEIIFAAEEEIRATGRQVKTVDDPNADEDDDDQD